MAPSLSHPVIQHEWKDDSSAKAALNEGGKNDLAKASVIAENDRVKHGTLPRFSGWNVFLTWNMLTMTFHKHHSNKSTAAAQLTSVRGVEYVFNIWFETAIWSV